MKHFVSQNCKKQLPLIYMGFYLPLLTLHEIFPTIDSVMMITEKCDFNFKRPCRFRAVLHNVVNTYERKMCETKQSSILSYFKTSTSATADSEPQRSK